MNEWSVVIGGVLVIFTVCALPAGISYIFLRSGIRTQVKQAIRELRKEWEEEKQT